MTDALLLTAIACGTALATGVGALPVLALGGERARAAQGVLAGLAAGVMAMAAVAGLLVPAFDQSAVATAASATVAGAPALMLSRRVLNHRAAGHGRSEAGALLAWLAVEQIRGLLPASFALAGGAMLALVVVDLLPDAWRHASHARVIAASRSAPR